MANFEIATKANLAMVLPGLLVALQLNLEQPSLVPAVTKTFHDGATLVDKEAVQMTSDDSKSLTGKAIVRHLADIANSNNTSSQRASSVCIWPRVSKEVC